MYLLESPFPTHTMVLKLLVTALRKEYQKYIHIRFYVRGETNMPVIFIFFSTRKMLTTFSNGFILYFFHTFHIILSDPILHTKNRRCAEVEKKRTIKEHEKHSPKVKKPSQCTVTVVLCWGSGERPLT